MGAVAFTGLAVEFSDALLPVVAVSDEGVDAVVAGAGDFAALPNRSW